MSALPSLISKSLAAVAFIISEGAAGMLCTERAGDGIIIIRRRIDSKLRLP